MLAPFSRSRFRDAGTRLAASAWRRWFLDRHAEFWLGQLGSAWSPSELRARVIDIIDETPDTKSFVLAPNRHWPGHRAGQFVPIEVEIDGVRVRRCYSISSGASGPGDRITITVKRVPGGRVSSWLHDHLRAGDLIGLGQPDGEFVVRGEAPLLLVAAGSGITPIIAILRDLEACDALRDVVLVHSARADGDAIFGRELATLAKQQPGLRLVAHRSGISGRIDAAALRASVPDLAGREVFVCGPPGLVDIVTHAGARHVHDERFVAAPRPPRAPGAPALVQLRGRRVAVDGHGSLLEQLERTGERPAHGSRMGICNTCRCRKRSGTVENLLTGEVSSTPDQDIKLCISIPHSSLELAL